MQTAAKKRRRLNRRWCIIEGYCAVPLEYSGTIFSPLKEKFEAPTLVYFTAHRASPAISHLQPAQTPLAALLSHVFRSRVFQRERYRARACSPRQRTFFSLSPFGRKRRREATKKEKKKRNRVTLLYTRGLSASSLISV